MNQSTRWKLCSNPPRGRTPLGKEFKALGRTPQPTTDHRHVGPGPNLRYLTLPSSPHSTHSAQISKEARTAGTGRSGFYGSRNTIENT